MKRKVIKQAGQAYTITLPIEWVRKNSITEKSELDLLDAGRTLIINSSNLVPGGTARLIVDGMSERNMFIHINALYARGIDEIHITAKKDISRELVRYLNSILGFALVSHEKNLYMIKDMSAGEYPHLDDIFKRVFQMILLFYDAAIQDICGKQQAQMEDLKMRDIEVNKFCLYLQRAINKMSYADAVKGRILFALSFALEKLSDEVERSWRGTIKHDMRPSKQLHEVCLLSKETLEKSFDLFYQFKPLLVDEIYPLRDEVRKKATELVNTNAKNARFVRHLVKIAEDAADLNHLILMWHLTSEQQ
ncbi:phosphate uptake regulator PhoU [Candidatus Pacearchaeota archaeon]|nr:phosphate uptake regulator PhoU [Candidatus Pacearchaeota archaeon]